MDHADGSINAMGGMGGMSGPGWMPQAPETLARLLVWHPQPIPVFPAACLLAALAYGGAVLRLRRRGDAWPPGRTIAFALGLVCVCAVTGTGIGGYGMELLSAHMIQHMTLSMLAPIPILLGAPITLALRTLHPAGPGRRGMREALLAVLHSRLAVVATSPFFTLPLLIASLYGLYFSSLFTVLMRTWWEHDLMLAHFVAVGLLFYFPLLGVDPTPRRPHPVIGILELMGGMPFHAFFGIAVMMSTGLITPVFAHPPAGWSVNPLSDQTTAGAIAWAFAEIPSLIMLLVMAARWMQSEARVARRTDRAADRDGNAELNAYNDYLAGLAHLADADRERGPYTA
jgi:putative membrane protein/putative copper resistance protein D